MFSRKIPLAKQLKQRSEKKRDESTKLNSLDDMIKKLEQQNDSSDSESINSEKDDSKKEEKIVLSEYERIEPLPKHLLPAARCRISHHDDNGDRKPKKIKFSDERAKIDNGLEATVRELLKNYEPSSKEKKPFYCRCCGFQGTTVDDFNEHKLTDLHKIGVETEKKMSYCKVCKKQFTSPDQLKGHIAGKAHKEQLDYYKSKHGNNHSYS